MSDLELEAFQSEFANKVVDKLIYGRTTKIIKSLLSRRDPTIYAGTASAADGLSDVVQNFVIEVLIDEGQLDYIFTVATSADDFDRLLRFQGRRYLARTRVRTVVDNLIDRAVRLLRSEDDVQVTREGRGEFFVRRDTDGTPQTLDSGNCLNRAVALAAAVPKILGDGEDRAPIVYSSEGLGKVVGILLRTCAKPICIADLDDFFSKLLTAWKPSFLGLDSEAANLADKALRPEDEVLAREEEMLATNVATSLADEMNSEEQEIFAFKHANLADRVLAAHLGISRQSLHPRKQRLFGRIADQIGDLSPSTQIAVLEQLSSIIVDIGSTE